MSSRRINRRSVLGIAAGVTLTAPVAARAAAMPGWRQGYAPAVISKQAADTEWDDMWKRAAEPYAGASLRVPAGPIEGHFGANAEAAAVFAELTGIESEWEAIPYDQQYQKIFLDLTSQSGT